jgi:hypothetical protein
MIIFSLLSQTAYAQGGLFAQSSSSRDWKYIENDFVKVIYPENYTARAIYVANLINYYSSVVGLSYGINKPKKVTLIIRDEVAGPNGFVALGPRRTEWFDSASFNPRIGSTEWLQSLSIHEYRHVQQFDDFKKNTVRVFDLLFGDTGLDLAQVMAKKAWMDEGDAVWAETKYSSGGRGRSPRFLGRLKAILLAGKIPTYDQFISGSYRDKLVNQYVYGYILISRAYQKFGEDFWIKMHRKLTMLPLPLRFESAFRKITGQKFKDFYFETFKELQVAWQKDSFDDLEATDFRVEMNPEVTNDNLYFVKMDLDSVPAIYRKTDVGAKKIIEIPYQEDFTRLDFAGDTAVYSEFLSDARYQFKGSSDLVLVNLKKGTSRYLTSGERLYNPHFGADGKTILAAALTKQHTWEIKEFDLNGHLLRTLGLVGWYLVEAASLGKDRVMVIAIDPTGKKALLVTQFGSNSYSVALAASYNNLFALSTRADHEVLFEAQYKGATEIFNLDVDALKFAQCTKSKISAFAPSFSGDSFYYSDQTPYGNRILHESLSKCSPIESTELIDMRYLGDNPSDAYNNFTPLTLPDPSELHVDSKSQYQEKPYSGFDGRAFIPHSWNFFAGRGFGAQVKTDNYLHDFGSNLGFGIKAEEFEPYLSTRIDFKKYYPVFSLFGDIDDRRVNLVGVDTDLLWREYSLGAAVAVPYIFTRHLYHFVSVMSYRIDRLYAQNFKFTGSALPGAADASYLKNSASVSLSYGKSRPYRALLSPWSVATRVEYQSVDEDDSDSLLGSYRVFGNVETTLPGLFTNNGIQLTASGQKNRQVIGHYVFEPPAVSTLGYVYSRGFTYLPSDEFVKLSGNYFFPLAYPDFNLGRWLYVKRLYMSLFFDHTTVGNSGVDTDLDSTGSELTIQATLFRFFTSDIGIRYLHTLEPSDNALEYHFSFTGSIF